MIIYQQQEGRGIINKIRALKASGLEVVARVALEPPPTDAASNYLRIKKEKMGHLLEIV